MFKLSLILTNLPHRIMESKNTEAKLYLHNLSLIPFQYHFRLRDHFKQRTKTWSWFSAKDLKTKHIEEFKSELLKNSYRLDVVAYQNLYNIANHVCTKLSIDADVTLYQEHNSIQLNAGISIIQKEAHIVLSGNLINLLNDDEMMALIAHELSHYLFYKIENEEFEITRRIVLALANDHRSEDALVETARIFQLYTELFCDSGALKVCEDYKIVIQMLVKLNTGLSHVNAESYLDQAKEIISNDNSSTTNTSHPESYIRCLALQMHAESNLEYLKKVEEMIEGVLDLNQLDIFNQVEMQEMTHQFLQIIVKPKWMNSAAILNLAAQYFQNFYKKEDIYDMDEFSKELAKVHDSVKSYLCYVMLDFAKVDADLEQAPLAHTIEISELLDLKDEYEKLIRKELKLTVRDFKVLKKRALTELQEVKEAKEDSIYNE